MKLACVVQRYGADIAGGSEAHCRQLARHLAPRHDVTVLTTCARDYVTWQNSHVAGVSTDDGVRVIRFPVSRTRRLKLFADLSDDVFAGDATVEREEAWFRENGPEVPALIDHLRDHGHEFDLVLFWAFRYYPTYFGLPLVADHAILLPTAEEDPAIDLGVLHDYLQRPAGYLFLTPEEEQLVSLRAGRTLEPCSVIGIGLDPPVRPAGSLASEGNRNGGRQRDLRHASVPARDTPYILYLGRVDRNKGCDTLLEYFVEYAAGGGPETLVLAGPATMRIPHHPQIRALGYVAEDARQALLSGAEMLVVPSRFESLSMVLLEAWNVGVPALVNGHCKVLSGQVRRANGGLEYRSAREFRETLAYLMSRPSERAALGRQGLEYVNCEYRWPTVLERVDRVLQDVLAKSTATSRNVPTM